MPLPMHRNQSVNLHQFTMIPRADIPRSKFRMPTTHKTTFDAGYLIPVYIQEVLPGDQFNVRMTAFARMTTPLYPVMDNLYLESHFFFVPNRLTWQNWPKMMGEQDNPGDSISYSIPQIVSKAGGYDINSLFDYMGLPTAGQVAGANTVSHSALPLRAYNLIYKEWYRDENLQNSPTINKGDGPDLYTDYSLLRRGKRKDYFTSALPWPQKGATAVSLPLGTTAPVKTQATDLYTGTHSAMRFQRADGGGNPSGQLLATNNQELEQTIGANPGHGNSLYPSNLYADLSSATAATINQLRLAFQTQRVLERDARGGTRYTEILFAHFNVRSPDARLQRPEYLGGGSTPINITPLAQTAQTGLTGGSTPLGTLAAAAAFTARNHGFTQAFVEHGYIIGLVSVRADLTYQQGLKRHWSRSTRYDYYLPAFAMLGEQAILNKEIYCDGSANDANAFGYAERWAELRNDPAMITGLFRSTAAGTLDGWHLAQKFTSLPTLNTTFIQDQPPLSRVLAVGAAANGSQFYFDSFFDVTATRPLPMYSVPGMIDHF